MFFIPILAGFIALKLLYDFVQWCLRLSKARARGCKPAPKYPHLFWDPLDIVPLRRIIRYDRSKHFPDLLDIRYREVCRQEQRDAPTFQFGVLGRKNYFTCDPKNIQALLATQFHEFPLGNTRIGNFAPLLGSGIFTQDGTSWEHSRAMLRPAFARTRVSDIELEERHNNVMMKALRTDASGWTPVVDLQILFFRLTIDSSTEFLFGESVNSQAAALPGYYNDSPDPSLNEEVFASAFDRAQWYLARRFRLGDNYWMYSNAEFRNVCKLCHNFIDHYVNLALSKKLKEKTAVDKSQYIFLEELAQSTRDPIELRSQLLNILLAGRDTTASMLGWLFFLLARHPQVWTKLRANILETFGDETNPQEITFATLKDCQYLQACMSEALRLYPVVPGNSRTALKDTQLPRGGGPAGQDPIFVPKGTQVNYSVHVMHRREALWGDDAAVFKPERWAGRRPGWEYLPFNGGPRICLGQQFALTSAGYATVRLLRRFDSVECAEPDPDIKHNCTLTSCSANGVKVRLHETR